MADGRARPARDGGRVGAGRPQRADPDRGGPDRADGRPLRRDQPARVLQPDHRHRRRRRLPARPRERPAVRRAVPRRARRRSPGRTRWRSSASATACPRATCPGSAASRCSWPRSRTRSSPAARSPTRPGSAAWSRWRSSPWSSTRAGTCSAFARQASDIAAGQPASSSPIPTERPRDQRRAATSCSSTRAVEDFVDAADRRAGGGRAGRRGRRRGRRSAPPPPRGSHRLAVRGGRAQRVGPGRAWPARWPSTCAASASCAGPWTTRRQPTTSVVRYTGADGDAARAVAEQLGGIGTEHDGRSPAGT